MLPRAARRPLLSFDFYGARVILQAMAREMEIYALFSLDMAYRRQKVSDTLPMARFACRHADITMIILDLICAPQMM